MSKASKEGKLSRCIKAPIRILARARNFYIRSMSDCAGNIGYGAVGVISYCPNPQVSTSFHKSFSVRSSGSSNDDDFSELIRAASTRSLGKKIELELLRQQQSKQSPTGGINVVPRSHTVAIGRIDEDKPCDFGELKTDLFPRSRSHAVTNKKLF